MQIKSLRPFLGAKDYEASRAFYRELGFTEKDLGHGMCVFCKDKFCFYLQKAYVKDWVDNTQVFLEVEDLDAVHKDLVALNLEKKFSGVKLTEIRNDSWGRECFLHDPSGILWHFGTFNS